MTTNNVFGNHTDSFDDHIYLKRTHIHNLLEKSIQKPVVTVIAGAGYGKTHAVYTFLREYEALTTWLQLTMLDNLGVRFWGSFINVVSLKNKKLASDLERIGFPETATKFDMFLSCFLEHVNPNKKHIIVYDDFHLLHERKTLQFVEKFINAGIPNLSFILISRSDPEINLAGLLTKKMISIVNENELYFSKNEMVRYFEMQEINLSPQLISRVYHNTGGWILAIRLIEFSIKKGVAHEDYAITSMKFNIYKMMESDVYSNLSEDVQLLLARLSLFDSLPSELVEELSAKNKLLINTLSQISSFIRFDSFSNMYYIHHLFLDFLRQKKDILTQNEKMVCYQKAAEWYVSNGYTIDAITCYGKAEDYNGILKVALFWPYASAEEGALVLDIMDKAQKELCDWEPMVALLHARAQWFVGKTTEFINETEAIIKMCEALPQSQESLMTLAEIYTSTGLTYYYLANTTNDFHFKDYLVRAYELVKNESISMKVNYNFQDVGTYVCRINSEKKEDMEAYLDAVKTAAYYSAKMMPGCMCGMYDLTQAEVFYFKRSLKEAEKSSYKALFKAREHQQHAIAIRAIFYLTRIYLAEGSYSKIQQCMEHLNLQLEIENSPVYKVMYDIVTSWFYSLIGLGDKAARWIKDNSEHANLNSVASGSENLAKLKYYICEKKYYDLLIFLEIQESVSDIKSFLFGEIAIEATKAICLYHLDQKENAIEKLQKAYFLAEPNDLIMQFVELGNDMAALAKFALKSEQCTIPDDWLINIQKKSSTYAKRITQVALEYKRANHLEAERQLNLTKKELTLLNDIFQGLSRTEIALNYGLSPNYVKNRLQAIYTKLGAKNANDAIRIAISKQLIK